MAAVVHRTGEFTGVRGVPIFYQSWLPENGVSRGVVVLVHGLGEHSGRYGNLVECLLPEGYGVYANDHQGFGRSGGLRGHVERFMDYVADVRQTVDLAGREHPGRPIALFGHSMGGLIGLLYALEHPDTVQFLVISAPALRAETAPHLVFLMRVMNLVRPTFTITRPGDGSGISRDPEVVRAFVEDPLYVPVSSARWAVEILSAQKQVMARAAELRLPLLMVQGTADTSVLPAATREFYERVSSPDKTLLEYEGYYHELHNDLGKEKPLSDITAWLNARMSP